MSLALSLGSFLKVGATASDPPTSTLLGVVPDDPAPTSPRGLGLTQDLMVANEEVEAIDDLCRMCRDLEGGDDRSLFLPATGDSSTASGITPLKSLPMASIAFLPRARPEERDP